MGESMCGNGQDGQQQKAQLLQEGFYRRVLLK